ncbi:MAG: general secretion pathway protein GspB [Lysobacteraceae bacterium]
MSLILEALKKSEAERRIGEAPGLLSPSASVPASKRRASRTWLWVLIPLLLLLALAAAWWLGRMGGSGTDADARGDSAAVATDGSDANAPPRTTSTGTESGHHGRRSDTVTPVATRTPTASATAPPPAPPQRPVPRTSATPQPPVSITARAPGERESVPMAPGALPEPPPRPVEREPMQNTADAPDAGTPATTSKTADPSRETLPTLRQLDGATRSKLPPLRISMHVFTDEPDGRFVIIDNHRYGEGASLASGLNIAEIRRDGVVMDYQGRRFLLDRPG